MFEQEGEQGVTLGSWNGFDACREPLVHKEALTPGDRVCAHDGVFGDRMGRITEVPTAIPVTVVLLAFVNRRESTDIRCIGLDNASKAAYMLAKSVSPPDEGT